VGVCACNSLEPLGGVFQPCQSKFQMVHFIHYLKVLLAGPAGKTHALSTTTASLACSDGGGPSLLSYGHLRLQQHS
jgi:hypothetical protein